MKKHHIKKEPTMKICVMCSWVGMKYKDTFQHVKCDMCGKHSLVFVVRACNLQ